MPPRQLHPATTAEVPHVLAPPQKVRDTPHGEKQAQEPGQEMGEAAGFVLAPRQHAVVAGGAVDGGRAPGERGEGDGDAEGFGVADVGAVGSV